jgi:class 3 adenylate cyclase/tetratricopeptide (TPR) repeat protein
MISSARARLCRWPVTPGDRGAYGGGAIPLDPAAAYAPRMLTCPACGRSSAPDAAFCAGCGTPLGATATAREVRKMVTALFCDLVGSTTLGEQHDPEVLRPLLHAYFEEMRVAVERHGGRVEKFIGDAVNAVFGLPVAHEDDALRAVRAAMEMVGRLAALSERSPIPLACRIGITTGEVLVPAHGEPLIGDAMNTAARLQAGAEPGSVVIGDATWRLVRDAVVAQPLTPLVLKGKAEPVPAYVVLEVGAAARAARAAAPFVGRERHLASLSRALEDAIADGAPVLATVLGEPGIGKSRLVDAFLDGLQGPTVLRALVPAAGEAASLAPVTTLIRAAGGGGAPAEVAAHLGSLIAGRPDEAALGAALRSLLGLGSGAAAESAWAFRRLLETLAARAPLVVALDDVQWAHAALADLIEDAARWTRGPVLFVCAARSDLLDAHPAWGGGLMRSVTMTVGPLNRDESARLADALLEAPGGDDAGAIDVPDATSRLVAAAEGNPLFLEHLAAEALEHGAGWDPTAAPTTIQALLDARLDRGSSELARLLEIASVQGVTFSLDVARALAPEIEGIESLLREAERAQLAYAMAPGLGTFAHALVREMAYRRLTKATRADLHAATADLLPQDDDELVGVHLERAAALRAEIGRRDPELERRAGERLASTGARAFARLDLATSADLLGRAARLLPRGSLARLEMLPDLAIALMENGRVDEARALLEGAVEEAEQAGSRRDAIRIRLQQLALHVYTEATEDQVRSGILEGRDLLDELATLEDDVGLAQGWIVVDYLHWLVGQMAEAEDASTRSVAHAERAGRLREQVQAGGDQATALIIGPRTVAEMRSRGEARRRSPNPIIAAGGEATVAAAAALAGEQATFHEAEARWRRQVEAGGLEWPGAYHALAALPAIHFEIDDPAGAEALLREGLAVMDRLGDIWVINSAGWWLPIALARQGRTDEAAVLADSLQAPYRDMDTAGKVSRQIALSIVATARGRVAEAVAHATQGIAIATTLDSFLLRTMALENLADLLRTSDPAAATAALREAATIHDAAGNVPGSARVARTLNAILRP